MASPRPIIIPVPPRPGTDARGRNGWFRPAEIRVEAIATDPPAGYFPPTWVVARYLSHQATAIELVVWSKRPAELPPILLRLDLESARALAEALTVTLADVIHIQGTHQPAPVASTDLAIGRP